ncbi:50S ribosomal protein L28 [Candidatus Woesebacteria bacterium RIFCSPHIGHO2_01_FULL_37_10]|uniref:Large ribosomal subunit protein bL28 n=1 Tax=Candidatus Woesebacteria bacterium RIFCSPHIGHO2_01_FULL_37_10 TaxID=1802489 RepID=A0A1F7XSL9_9BACT|nr:MAG: 50S ribosomal protein L28 [Candidatus Woesebacteria bacterium RIFCSPHIGHO2_01_FULL_37_10]
MSYACQICGKKTTYGRSQTHRRGVAGKRWKSRAPETKRLFKPNLQRKTLIINGVRKQMKICTKCLKRIRKFGSINKYKNIAAV